MVNAPLQPPRPGGDGIWKWLGIGCLGLVLLAVVGTGALIWVIGRNVKINTDPAAAEQAAHRIMDYRLPGGSQGLFAFDSEIFRMAAVRSPGPEPAVVLTLGQMDGGALDQETFESQMRQTLQRNSGSRFVVQNQSSEPRTLCGKPITLVIASGTFSEGEGSSRPGLSYTALISDRETVRLVAIVATGPQARRDADHTFSSLTCR